MLTDPARAYQCRDGETYDHPIERVFDVLTDLTTYNTWWTLIRTTPLDTQHARLAPGVRYRVEGARPGGNPTSWVAEVLSIEAPHGVELDYVEGDLLGRVAWELESIDGRTRATYVYRGVRANAPSSAATFERFGTRLHSVAMAVDALAGLRRFLDGRPLDESWQRIVHEAMASGVASLTL